MVTPEVREAGHRERGAVDPVFREGVRADLHRDHVGAAAPQLGERALQLGCLGRGERQRCGRTAEPNAERADDAGSVPMGREHGVEEEGGGGLAVGAGDAEHRHRTGRLPVESGGHRADRPPDRPHPRLGHRGRDDALDHERDGTPVDGDGREVVAVGVETGDAAEQRARMHGATVVGHVGHVGGRRDIRRIVDDLEHLGRVQEVVQAHGILSYGTDRNTLPVAGRDGSEPATVIRTPRDRRRAPRSAGRAPAATSPA